jgi:3-phosphoshikimate 1-carboxyvinyltransferase
MLPEEYNVITVKNPRPVEVSVPGSKSITNRALLLAAMADGKSVLEGVLFSDDSRYFLQALIDLGFEVDVDEAHCTVTVTGCGGKVPHISNSEEPSVREIYVGSAGTAARFLTAYLGLSKGRFLLRSSDQMKKRPMKELLAALEALGAVIAYKEEPYHFPFEIGCTAWKTHETTVDVEKSSQFLSALLIVSVLSAEDFTIHVAGSHGMAYVEMTVQMMEQFGVRVLRPDAHTFVVPAGQHYHALEYPVEPDVSAACYFYAMSPLLNVPAMVRGVHRDCMQGDIRFLEVLEDMGCSVTDTADGVKVLPPPDGVVKGGVWDLSGFSDQTLTLASIAPFADAPVTISHVGHIRMQECDRIHAILHNLRAMGISCIEEDGAIFIEPGKPQAAVIETYEDHRVAMAFTLPGLVSEGIVIKNPACCRKTFERYFDVLEEVLYS